MLKNLMNWLLAATFVLVPLVIWLKHYEPFVTMKNFVFLCMVITMFALLLIHYITTGQAPFRKQPLFAAVGSYFLFNLASFLYFEHTDKECFFLLSGHIMLFFTVGTITDEFHKRLMINILIGVSLLSSIYGVFQFFGVDYGMLADYFGSRFDKGTRLFTFFGNPNLLGGFCVLITPLIAASFIDQIDKKPPLSWVLFFILVLNLATLYFTQTRGSMIAMVLSMGIFFLLSVRQKGFGFIQKNRRLVISLGSAAVLFCAALAISIYFSAGFANLTTANIRLFMYATTLRMIGENPFFGSGVGTFKVFYPAYRDSSAAYRIGETQMEFRVEHPHNEHLELLSDLGIVGYLLFVWIVIEALKLLSRKNDWTSIGIFAAICGLLIDGLLSQNLRFTVISSTLWLMFGLSAVKDEQSVASQAVRINLLRGSLVLLVVSAAVILMHSAYRTMKADEYVSSGMEFYSDKMPRDALKSFAKALEYDPTNKRALYYAGISVRRLADDQSTGNNPMQQEQYSKEALKLFLKLLNEDPNFIQANYHVGVLYFNLNEQEKANRYLKRQVEVNNMYWQAFYPLALLEAGRGNRQQALEYVEEIEKINRISPIPDQDYSGIRQFKGALLSSK